MPEFLVFATETRTGQAYPPFVVPAEDEPAVRRICRRAWLRVEVVEPYTEQLQDYEPPVLPWGPPLSDKSFDRVYHNQPGEPGSAEEVPEEVGWLFFRAVFRVFWFFH
jgi:hypothetical protein